MHYGTSETVFVDRIYATLGFIIVICGINRPYFVIERIDERTQRKKYSRAKKVGTLIESLESKHSLYILTNQAARKLQACYNRELSSLGITAQQMVGLGIICSHEDLRVRDQNPALVIAYPLGDTSEKLKCPDMTFPVAFCAFTLKSHHKKSIRIRQYHHKNATFLSIIEIPCWIALNIFRKRLIEGATLFNRRL